MEKVYYKTNKGDTLEVLSEQKEMDELPIFTFTLVNKSGDRECLSKQQVYDPHQLIDLYIEKY